ncbi:hypothetical protein HY382_00760 [Candidatus Curtissbacteria bacterium]|nr:hypothetical protein [Candidatus Curtissbacteria bacterium]
MNIREIENILAKFLYDLETEDRLVRVGLKDKLESAKIYKKYERLFSQNTLEKIGNFRKEVSRKDKELTDRIYFTLVSGFVGQRVAPLEDLIKTYFANATTRLGSEKISYFEIAPKIAKETIFDKREKLDSAALAVVTKANPKQLKLLIDETSVIKDLGFKGYLHYFSESKKVNYDQFYKVIKKILKLTDKIWLKTMGRVSQEVLRKPFENLNAVHMGYLRSLSMYDNFYPKEKVITAFTKFTNDLGLVDLLNNIKIDDANRPKKNPRAVCYWPKPPSEVHLVIKPIGGEQDFEAAFHEGGHALHGAAVSESLPFTFRALSRSNALTEAYAFIFEDLIFDPVWLSTNLNVSAFTGNKILWQATFVNLMLLRRYLGKFSYEHGMFSKDDIKNGPKLYAKNLKDATGFVFNPSNWLSDMDSGFYSADYLRAWIGAAQIKDYVVKKFGKRWFENIKAGEYFRSLYARGVTDELEDVVKRLGYGPWDISYLVENYKKVLG